MRLSEALQKRRQEGLYRERKVLQGPQSVEVEHVGRRLINFCSNDYLGLAGDRRVIEAFRKSAAEYGAGSGSAHLVCGHSQLHHQLEEALAEFTGRDRALLFSTGYMVNIGVISALLGKGDAVFEDRLNHASLIDGGLMSQARFRRYRHADGEALDSLLSKSDSEEKLVVTDGVFSMDGDIAPLPELVDICRRNDALLMVDDAHGFGVLGKNGAGCAEHFSLSQAQLPLLVGTLGKAFGTFGAFVAGSEETIEYLIQQSRTYIYTTALPPAVAGATLASLEILRAESWRRERLRQLVGRFRSGAKQLGLELWDSPTPIQPVIVGSSEAASHMSDRLMARGFWVGAIRPPTVPQGSARLRVTFSAAHTDEQVDKLLDALAVCGHG